MTLDPLWHGTDADGGSIPEETNYVKNPKPIHSAASIPTDWTAVNSSNSTYTYADGATSDGIVSKHVNIVGAAGCSSVAGVQFKEKLSAGDVSPGDSVTASVSIGNGSLTGCTLMLRMYWYNGATPISTSDGTPFTPGSPFATHILTAVCPGGANTCKIQLVAASNFSSGDEQHYDICRALVTLTVSATPIWFDGDSIGGSWSGTQNASASTRQLCRAEAGAWIVEDTSNVWNPVIQSPPVAATPGTYYGASAVVAVPEVAGGTFSVDIRFYDDTDTYISGQSITEALTSITTAAVFAKSVLAPADAAFAVLRLWWNTATDATGDCRASVSAATIGAETVTAPAVLSCADQHGDCAAPWLLGVDGSAQEINAFYAGRYPDETADIGMFAFEADEQSWSGGAHTTDTASYPNGSSNQVWSNQSAVEVYADLDVSDLRQMEYLVLAKCKATTADTGTVRHTYCAATAIPTTSLQLLPLGVITLPPETLRIYLAGDGTNYGYLNAIFLIPVGRGGVIGWRVTSGHAHTLRWEDDVLYVDDETDLSGALGARPIIGLRGALVMVAEQSTPAPTTALTTALTVVPRYEHFPSA